MMTTLWAKGIISAIPKSKDSNPRIPLNYRGISLLSVVSKLYTSLIATRLSSQFEKNNTLVNEPNGSRPERSCLDHIFTLINACKIRKNLRQETFLVFIDYQKAFDYINHDLLYFKLRNMGVTGDLYFSIKNIYQSPKSCVTVNGHLTPCI